MAKQGAEKLQCPSQRDKKSVTVSLFFYYSSFLECHEIEVKKSVTVSISWKKCKIFVTLSEGQFG